MGGSAKCKASCPPALAAANLRGLRAQLERDNLQAGKGISITTLDRGCAVDTETREMTHLSQYEDIWDEVTEVRLPPEKVAAAWSAEIDFLEGFPVYKMGR